MSGRLREIAGSLASGIILPRSTAGEVLAAADEIERLREDAGSAWECLDMVRETLVPFLGEDDMKGTAPMFYPEAIRSAMFRAQRGDYLPSPTPTNE